MKEQNIERLILGQCRNPFSFLGQHTEHGQTVFRTFQPGATAVAVLDRLTAKPLVELTEVKKSGFFEGYVEKLPARFVYVLQVQWENETQIIEDPYRFGTLLTSEEFQHLKDPHYPRTYEILGAHLMTVDDIEGTRFTVFAPNAERVSVVGDFNFWDGRRHVMRFHPAIGLWEIFIPGITENTVYQYEIIDAFRQLRLKSDPYAFASKTRPDTTSLVASLPPKKQRTIQQDRSNQMNAPISIYEVHLGSWRRNRSGEWLTYHDLAEQLLPYVKEMGFTHIELLPIHEHPYDASWGYQPLGLYSPTRRFGDPDGLIDFINTAHELGINVILDWVPGHFPSDPSGLEMFDGTALFEYSDPKEGLHRDWQTLIYNYRRHEVRQFLTGNALYWIERFGFDGLRVDAVASMIYRDYSRPDGEWIANEHGGNINLEAVDFLRETNETVHRYQPGTATIAEESTSFAGVTLPPEHGGLGFNYKWNMGWMHDTLNYLSMDPINRKYHHDKMTFGVYYAWSENFVLPLSHDEVVHGKGSLIRKMSGVNVFDQMATLRAYYAWMWAHPGKKLLFMGNEFAQWNEWDHDSELDWYLLETEESEDEEINAHLGVQTLVKDLNFFYRKTPAFYALDHRPESFKWRVVDDKDNSVFAFIRRTEEGESILVVSNFTPVLREDYRIGVDIAGIYQEVLNTDRLQYGGQDRCQKQGVLSKAIPMHHCKHSISVTLPPLTTLYFQLQTSLSKKRERVNL